MNSLLETFLNKPLVNQFLALWEAGASPPDVCSFLAEHSEAKHDEQVAVLLIDQSRRWSSGKVKYAEEYLVEFPEIFSDKSLKLEIIIEEFRIRHEQGQKTDVKSFIEKFPDVQDSLRERLIVAYPKLSVGLISTFSQENVMSELDTSQGKSIPENRSLPANKRSVEDAPAKIGRYQIERVLGEGTFGRVFLSVDEELNRRVAIKVPYPDRVPHSENIEAYLSEARIAAGLDHPNIVPVYDIGQIEDGSTYIVSKYIEGGDLNEKIRSSCPSPREAAELMALVADALSSAHKKGLVHRDIKPSNILLDQQSQPYVADFGLAVHEDQQRKLAGEVAGTPAYMAPEQVRGDTHRLDGRCDIWSCGAILYELLTGRRPFTGESRVELFDEIQSRDPKPPRQIDESIPHELERICLKCLSKQITDRYTTATDLAEDLRHWTRLPVKESYQTKFLIAGGLLVIIAIVVSLLLMPESSPPQAVPLTDKKANPSTEQELKNLLSQLKETLKSQNHQLSNKHAGLPSAKQQQQLALPAVTEDGVALPGEFTELEKQLKEARDIGDEKKESSLLLRATNDLVDAGHFSIAEALAERMVELAGNDPARRPFAYGQLGLAQYRGGRAEQAIPNFYESLKNYRIFYNKMQQLPESPQTKEYSSAIARLLGIDLMRIGNANKALERYQNAQDVYDEAKEILEKHDRKKELITLLLNYGSLESARGNHQDANVIFDQGLELARSLHDEKAEAEMLLNRGNAYSRASNNAKSLEDYQAADKLIEVNSSYELRTTLLSNWSTSLVEEGRFKEAKNRLAELKEIASPSDKASQRVLELLQGILKLDELKPKAD